MHVTWMPQHNVGEESSPTRYRVRIWTAPEIDGYAWAADEYELQDAADVVEALNWARDKANKRPFELFVLWIDNALSPSLPTTVEVPMMTRLIGEPPADA